MTTRFSSAHLEINVTAPAHLVFSVALTRDYAETDEALTLSVDGQPLEAEEVLDSEGTRLHQIHEVPTGLLVVDYNAEVRAPAAPRAEDPIDRIIHTRPSRYCDSDRLHNVGRGLFPDLHGPALFDAVTGWVRRNIAYVPGSSRVVDGALETYLSRQGVCRDFAHLVITFLRGLDVPTRMASVYAPGLSPMDFHAVAEAWWDGQWYALDATGLAPRESMMRIATGRDASDTAFLTTLAGRTSLQKMVVTATTDGDLPHEDTSKLVTLA